MDLKLQLAIYIRILNKIQINKTLVSYDTHGVVQYIIIQLENINDLFYIVSKNIRDFFPNGQTLCLHN